MEITIDTNVLVKHNITADEYMYLYCLKYDEVPPFHLSVAKRKLERMRLVKFDSFTEECQLRPKIEEIFPVDSEEIKDWIQDYRLKFKGTRDHKPMGIKPVVLKKMKDFVKNNPEYTKDDILSATDRYINACAQAGVPNRQADYFIYKRVDVDGEIVNISELLTVLEDLEDAENTRSIVESLNSKYNGDWK